MTTCHRFVGTNFDVVADDTTGSVTVLRAPGGHVGGNVGFYARPDLVGGASACVWQGRGYVRLDHLDRLGRATIARYSTGAGYDLMVYEGRRV